MEDKLKEYGLKVYWNRQEGRNSDDPDDYLPIDFNIDDGTDNVAWIWGSMPDDVEVECNHPEECIEFGDDEDQGECKLCGATCDWHWEKEWLDEGHGEDGGCIGHGVQTRYIDEWYYPKRSKGLIGEYLKELGER